VYHIEVKTHKLTVMHAGLDASTTISQIKSWTLSALTSDVATDSLDVQAMDPPPIDVQTGEDFELCRAVKERGKPTGVYEVVDPSMVLRDSGFIAWEVLFLQFRDRDTGKHSLLSWIGFLSIRCVLYLLSILNLAVCEFEQMN
jgi:hypothetical protein